jgi:uncharacterized protein with FMN-binding domain
MMKHDDDKLELLLKMMEHPEKYTEQQLQNMLDDADCRDFYELTVKAEHGYEARRDDGRVDEETLDEEWRRFEATHLPRRRFAEWRQWAAVFIGVLLLSGIALAAIHFVAPRSVRHAEAPARTVVAKNTAVKAMVPTAKDSVGTAPETYEDATLQTILTDLSAYYKVQVTYKSERVKAIRLYIKWDKRETLEQMVEKLNSFDKVSITLTDHQMVVE